MLINMKDVLAHDLRDWIASADPVDLVLPRAGSGFNQQLLAAAGRTERRRMQVLGALTRLKRPDLSERYRIEQFVQALDEMSALERGALLRTYQVSYGMTVLEWALDPGNNRVDEAAEHAFLGVFANAYTRHALLNGLSSTHLPLFFDAFGCARFPGMDAYLEVKPEVPKSCGQLIARGEVLEIALEGRVLGTVSLDELLGKRVSVSPRVEAGAGDGSVRWRRRVCIPGNRIFIENREPVLRLALEQACRTMNDAFVRGGAPRPSDALDFVDPADEGVRELLRTAVDAVFEVWPEAHHDLEEFTQVVIPFDMTGIGLMGSTPERMYGVTIHRVRPPDVVVQASNLLHENAHKRLLAIRSLYPTELNDGSERVSSPWRMDARPIRGVMLGLHAFAVVAQFYARAIASRMSWAESLKPELIAELDRLTRGLATVRSFGELTQVGEHLVTGIEQSIEESRAIAALN
jgi:hypothetical protein